MEREHNNILEIFSKMRRLSGDYRFSTDTP